MTDDRRNDPPARRRLRLIRLGLAIFAIALFLGTHWPSPTPTGRALPVSDKVIHAAGYFIGAVLLLACRFFGPAGSVRNVLWCAGLALAFAGVDEATQAIPALSRTASWGDLAADTAGVALAAALAVVLGRIARRGRAVPTALKP